jgi:hypothetical protein
MIDQSMIPMEVKRAMRVTWARRNNSDAPEKHMADLAVAMLEAWPGKAYRAWDDVMGTGLYAILPLTEARDDR